MQINVDVWDSGRRGHHHVGCVAPTVDAFAAIIVSPSGRAWSLSHDSEVAQGESFHFVSTLGVRNGPEAIIVSVLAGPDEYLGLFNGYAATAAVDVPGNGAALGKHEVDS